MPGASTGGRGLEETSQNIVFGRCGLQGVAHSEVFCTLPVRRLCKTQCWQIGGLRKHIKTRRVANTGCRKYCEMQQRFCAWVSLIMTTRYTSWQTEERKEKLGKPSAHNNCRTGLTSAKAYVLQTLLAGRVINAMFSQGGSQETSQSVLFDGHGLHFCAL